MKIRLSLISEENYAIDSFSLRFFFFLDNAFCNLCNLIWGRSSHVVLEL